VTLDKTTGLLTSPPQVVSSGLLDPTATADLFARVGTAVQEALARRARSSADGSFTSAKVKETARKILYRETGRRPMIIPVTLEV